MPDKKISELVNLTSLATDDEFVVVDADANATKRITATNLSKFPSGVTVPDGGTIGSASDADAITIDATGNVALSQALQLGDSTAISSLGADSYRLTANATSGGTLTAWERVDETTSATLGTGVSESSGTFNVPNTGIWMIIATLSGQVVSSDPYVALFTRISGDTANSLGVTQVGASNTVQYSTGVFIGALTSANNITFDASSVSGGAILGDTSSNQTHVSFVRLGDS